MTSEATILKQIIEQTIIKIDVHSIQANLGNISVEKFDNMLYETLMNTWLEIGDKGYFSVGYHDAVSTIQKILFDQEATTY